MIAVCLVVTLGLGFRSGVMPGNSRWPWDAKRETSPAMFWLAASIYTLAALLFAWDAIVGFIGCR